MVYWLVLHRVGAQWALAWLILASLFFYSWWKLDYLPLILAPIIFNFVVGRPIGNLQYRQSLRKLLLGLGIIVNLGLQGYFKYYDFFVSNIALLTGSDVSLLHLVLPLGISFFTFQQVAYLVDAYKGGMPRIQPVALLTLCNLFPQLIAGPIVHHSEMLP